MKLLDLSKTVSRDVQRVVSKFSFSSKENRGAVFTKPSVVRMMLDAGGYRANSPLYERTILEPCFGGGDFLFEIIDRLLESFFSAGHDAKEFHLLEKCITAVELHVPTFEETGLRVERHLKNRGLSQSAAAALRNRWLLQGDFLLTHFTDTFDFVVGNPPYLRQEAIPSALLKEYGARYTTLYDRADLYVLFFERALSLLRTDGTLSFICSDRWMKNKYGGPLRKFISSGFHIQFYVNMFGYPAFHDEVSAYTAVTVICKQPPQSVTNVCFRPPDDLRTITYEQMTNFTVSDQPWVLEESVPLRLLRRLENDFPTLEETGCKVGIGVATGSDEIYIGNLDDLPVEKTRKIPLVMRRDLTNGRVDWSGHGVINVFDSDGRIVSLEKYPKLRNYFECHRDAIKRRNVARRNKTFWYRTIDRIDVGLITRHKLLIPDIGDRPQIVHERGRLYPHHNLYYVVSDAWDLDALKAILMSSVVHMFMKAYSVKMRGGYVRYQAQYLRKIRLPLWNDLPASMKELLRRAGRTEDLEKCDRAAAKAYNLSRKDFALLTNGRTI